MLVILVLVCLGFNVFTINTVSATNKKDYNERYNALEQKCRKKFKYEYDSPVGMSIIVKNDKIIKVIDLM